MTRIIVVSGAPVDLFAVLGPGGISGDVVELVELLGPAVFQYLVNIEKARTPQHDARNVLEPTEGFGRASCLLLLSGKMWKLSKVIPVIQQRPLLFL